MVWYATQDTFQEQMPISLRYAKLGLAAGARELVKLQKYGEFSGDWGPGA